MLVHLQIALEFSRIVNVPADKFFTSLDGFLESMLTFFMAKAGTNVAFHKEVEAYNSVCNFLLMFVCADVLLRNYSLTYCLCFCALITMESSYGVTTVAEADRANHSRALTPVIRSALCTTQCVSDLLMSVCR